MPKPARKLAVPGAKRSTHSAGGAAAPTSKPALKSLMRPMMGAGWGPIDPQASAVQTVSLEGCFHLALQIKVTDAGTATWSSVARVSQGLGGLPDTGRLNLPCAVRDASTGKLYQALASVSSSGNVAVTKVGTTRAGSMAAPFALALNDEVHISFVYAA